MNDLDPAAFAAALANWRETDCVTSRCNRTECRCLGAAIRAYIAHISATPADLRTVLAFEAGVEFAKLEGKDA